MTEQVSVPEPDHEQLQLDIELPHAPRADSVEQPHSLTFLDLQDQRDAAAERHRAPARAIARAALAALRAGEITNAEFAQLLPLRDETSANIPSQRQPSFDDLSAERPLRPLDHAELAAGEGVERRHEDN